MLYYVKYALLDSMLSVVKNISTDTNHSPHSHRQFRLVDCSALADFCQHVYMSKRPSFAVMRPEHGIDVHYGRAIVHDVIAFAQDSVRMPSKTLSPADFPLDSDMWFIDFFAPVCLITCHSPRCISVLGCNILHSTYPYL